MNIKKAKGALSSFAIFLLAGINFSDINCHAQNYGTLNSISNQFESCDSSFIVPLVSDSLTPEVYGYHFFIDKIAVVFDGAPDLYGTKIIERSCHPFYRGPISTPGLVVNCSIEPLDPTPECCMVVNAEYLYSGSPEDPLKNHFDSYFCKVLRNGKEVEVRPLKPLR